MRHADGVSSMLEIRPGGNLFHNRRDAAYMRSLLDIPRNRMLAMGAPKCLGCPSCTGVTM